MAQKKAIIIGAGPAGLTAAYELVHRTDVKPVIFEATCDIGGISKTVNYKGNRIDIGGHRFFSKSNVVMDWWRKILPLQGAPSRDDKELGRKLPLSDDKSADPEKIDKVMLFRGRLSRIFFLRKFFDYPIALSLETIMNLGLIRMGKIGISYVLIRLLPIKEEKSLEDFFINRFGKELYLTFFKDYTEKVWGIACSKISPAWGAQRIKGLSISKAIANAVQSMFAKDTSIDQKNVETSLIQQFMYPKLGPGQLWEEVADIVKTKGGELHMKSEVVGVKIEGSKVVGVTVKNTETGKIESYEGDFFFSTMPVKDLINAMGDTPDSSVKEIANGLMYRDFMTVGLLLNKLKISNKTNIPTVNNIVPDNWIYIQERDVKVGRLQIFNNWSPYMVSDPEKAWIGLEYFCNEGDELWSMDKDKFIQFAISELEKIGIIDSQDVLDSVLIKIPKAYPAYFGSYDKFSTIKDYVNKLENLFLIGRNGMHSYNNQDHSMLTAIEAVNNIGNGVTSKDNIWSVNTEEEYHEEK